MFDTELTKNTICPYCGYEDQDSWELSSNSGETQCGNCDKEFHYERDIEVSYTTTKVEPNENVSKSDEHDVPNYVAECITCDYTTEVKGGRKAVCDKCDSPMIMHSDS